MLSLGLVHKTNLKRNFGGPMSMGQVSPFTQPQDAIVTKVSVGIPGIKMAGDDWNPGWGGT